MRHFSPALAQHSDKKNPLSRFYPWYMRHESLIFYTISMINEPLCWQDSLNAVIFRRHKKGALWHVDRFQKSTYVRKEPTPGGPEQIRSSRHRKAKNTSEQNKRSEQNCANPNFEGLIELGFRKLCKGSLVYRTSPTTGQHETQRGLIC